MLEEVLDYLDPEWRERWKGDAEEASEYYQMHSFSEWQVAYQKVTGENW